MSLSRSIKSSFEGAVIWWKQSPLERLEQKIAKNPNDISLLIKLAEKQATLNQPEQQKETLENILSVAAQEYDTDSAQYVAVVGYVSNFLGKKSSLGPIARFGG